MIVTGGTKPKMKEHTVTTVAAKTTVGAADTDAKYRTWRSNNSILILDPAATAVSELASWGGVVGSLFKQPRLQPAIRLGFTVVESKRNNFTELIYILIALWKWSVIYHPRVQNTVFLIGVSFFLSLPWSSSRRLFSMAGIATR
jgi:hypothetical protein